MDRFFDTADLQQVWQDILHWLELNALNIDNAVQLGVVGGAFVLALGIAPRIRRGVIWASRLHVGQAENAWRAMAGDTLATLALPLSWLCLQWISGLAAEQAG